MSERLRAGLRDVVAARAALDSLERQLVVQARSSGCTWTELAEDLQLSAAGARRRHLAVDPLLARHSLKPPTIAEYHEEFVAAMRAQGVFVE